jgi:hypothetical protein
VNATQKPGRHQSQPATTIVSMPTISQYHTSGSNFIASFKDYLSKSVGIESFLLTTNNTATASRGSQYSSLQYGMVQHPPPQLSSFIFLLLFFPTPLLFPKSQTRIKNNCGNFLLSPSAQLGLQPYKSVWPSIRWSFIESSCISCFLYGRIAK